MGTLKRYIPEKRRIFYVYEHWRPDKDICFWVGKGKGSRANWYRRSNFHYNNIVAKLERLGLCVEVRLVKGTLLEKEAFVLEKQRISFWRSVGVDLANKTDGGEGACGCKSHIGKRQPQDMVERRRQTLLKFWNDNPDQRQVRSEKVKQAYKDPVVKKRHLDAISAYITDPKFADERSKKVKRSWETRKKNRVGG